ncbi:two-component regulator propeller domain-containing protein [Arcicella aquatica]|uniref:histidine kinase n=1 Tax=Arcicella aquatica TaxID=217141 RepID=A0ABU5QS31_9BACT|nr:two-component regulator propeller domain-containing protein [Arcicella aquatica]MEA5259685.1 two-component regulator propeller domain-containing protein [Arcicella aquatica]
MHQFIQRNVILSLTYLFIFWSLGFLTYAQIPSLKFKHITNEQGLSNSTIESIYQDSRGFMWFGTRDGLNRYDGNQIVVFKNNPNDEKSISDNYITYIHEDKNKTLWVGTINGLNRFDERKNTFTRFKHNPQKPRSITDNYITCIKNDSKGRLWICTRGGINLLQSSDGNFIAYRKKQNVDISLTDNHINCLFEDSSHNLWVGTESGIQLFDTHNGTFQKIDAFANLSFSLKGYAVNCINEDKQGNLLIGTNGNGLIIYNHQLGTIKQYSHQETQAKSLANNLVKAILIDDKKNIWVGCINGGLNLFDPVSGSFLNYQYRPEDPNSLSQRTVSALFEDNQGNLWVGTHRGGINLYMPKTEKFTLFRQESNINSLSYNDVKAFCEDRFGNIWIGTDGGGLNLFNRKDKSFKHFKYSPFHKNTIGSNEVLGINEDTKGNLWVATWGGGLSLYNRATNTFSRFLNNPANKNSVSSNYIQTIFEDSKQNLWIATYYGGLNLFDHKTGKFTRVIYGKNNQSQLQGNNIISINEDKKGNIWIGTDDAGLNCLNTATQTFTHYFNNDSKKPDLRVIFTDKKGRVWVGQMGLYLFNEKQNTFSIFTSKANLDTEFIKGIVEDDEGNLWIATSNGITQLNPQTMSIKKYNTADGLQGLEFEANASLMTKDGQVFFGGVNGFNTFYPHKITTNTFTPPVYITDFQLFNKKVDIDEDSPLEQDISFAQSIDLSYKQSTFSFGFAALNYTASENNQYAYKLENWDKDWIYVNNEKKASYTNVSPGDYTFHIKATNNDGVWNEKGYTIEVNITPPFWATWWFKTLVALSILSGIAAFYNFKRTLEIQQLEEQKKEEIHQEQLQFFTNISHEFRTPLSLILGPLEKLKREFPTSPAHPYYDLMYRNANRLISLINELMDFRKVESGVLKLNVMEGNINTFLKEISEEFSDLASEKKITFEVFQNNQLDETWFDRQILEKIIINLLSNAFKYIANGKHITLEVMESLEKYQPKYANELLIPHEYKGSSYLYIRVSDDGIGISKESIPNLFERYYKTTEAHLGSGIGLAFVKSLTKLHKGSIWVYSEKEKGTEIIIGIPCKREDYAENERWIKNKDILIKLESISSKYEVDIPINEEVAEKKSLKSTQSLAKPTILVVDDNDELRTFLKDALHKNYHILEAINGQQGYEKAKECFPDLIISDVMMPVMNGNIFCKKVKDDDEISHIPFLMLTAKDATESKIEGVESGADFYFSKPLSIELLELTIKNIFIQKQKLKEKYGNDQLTEIVELAHSQKDKAFLTELIQMIEAHLSNPEMNIDYICAEMGMSRTKLYTKVKELTGQAIGDFIRSIRLKKAVQLMTQQNMPIAEVMYNVGIQTQSYFTKAFKNEFGKTPMQFLKDLKK